MKLSFKDAPIRYKLMTIILVVTFVALLAFSLFTYFNQRNIFMERVTENLTTQARIIAENSTASLNFNDTMTATTLLQTLSKDSAIQMAVLYDVHLHHFASFCRDSVLPVIQDLKSMTSYKTVNANGSIHLLIPVDDEVKKEECIGYLFLSRNLNDFNTFVRHFLISSLILLFFILLAAVLMAVLLQKIVSKPIVRLAQMTRTITETGNYKIDLPYQADDETGQLVSGFNTMLKTIDTHSEELIKTREEALKNAKVKEEFLSNMSREIRTPLNVIVGLSNVLIDTGLSDEQRRYIRNIRTSSDQVLTIVNDILDYSKISSGSVEFEKKEFPVTEVAQEVIDSLKSKASEKGLELKMFTGPGIPSSVAGDRLKLYHILFNLTGNALKFTNQGYVHLFIESLQQNELTHLLSFSVRDTGIGIPSDKQKLVFESFRQGFTETSHQYGGSGLGLAISKQLVEMQGGKIEMESRPGQGTTIRFTILYNKADLPKPAVYLQGESHSKVREIPRRARILVIGEPAMNRMMVMALQKFTSPSQILSVVSVAEAKEALINQSFQAILSDLFSEAINVPEFIRFVREELTGIKRNTPILGISSGEKHTLLDSCLKAGMNDFVVHPLQPDVLFNKLIQHLNQRL